MALRIIRVAPLLVLVSLIATEAKAGISITNPTTTTTWTEGQMQNVTFTYDRGCSGGTAKIYGPGKTLWTTTFGAQSGSPVNIPLQVPPE